MPSDDPVKATGLSFRANAGTRRYYWSAPRAAVKAGFGPKITRVFGDDVTPGGREEIQAHAARLNAEALRWLDDHGERPFDGTVKGLILRYQRDAASPYQEIKWNTRRTYDQMLSIIEKTVGARLLKALALTDFREWYAEAKKPGEKAPDHERVDRAHRVIVMLRRLMSYGTAAEIPECARLQSILQNTRFKAATPHRGRLTYEQVQTFIKAALAAQRASLALATAIQFESTFRQRDVIGEWEPIGSGAPDPGGIVLNGRRWVNGLTWGDLREDGTLIKRTTKTGAIIAHDFRLYPLAWSLIEQVPTEQRVGPLIIDERTRSSDLPGGRPYAHLTFGQQWRIFADKAGLPSDVWNSHARAGGISEADEAGADLDQIGHQAGQSQRSTTGRYVRGTIGKTRAVAELRLAYRAAQKDGKNG